MAERADQRSMQDRNGITCSNRPIKKDMELPAVIGRELRSFILNKRMSGE